MHVLLAILVGVLFAAGLYMLLRRSFVKFIIGVSLISHSVNLLIFLMGGVVRGEPPVIPEGMHALSQPHADPLPQALILTAIVIGFAVLAFFVVLIRRVHQTAGSEDIDDLRAVES